MKISCDRTKLLTALNRVSSVYGNQKNGARRVVLAAGQQALSLAASGPVGYLQLVVDGARATEPGCLAAQTDELLPCLQTMPDKCVRLEGLDKQLILRGSRSELVLQTVYRAQAPETPQLEKGVRCVLPTAALKRLLRCTLFAADRQSIGRYALGGVRFEVHGDVLTAVATDGRRLAVVETPVRVVDRGTEEIVPLVGPAAAMRLLDRVLKRNKEEAILALRDGELLVRAGGVFLQAQPLEGRFPDWRAVFPSYTDKERIELQSDPFREAVLQACDAADSDEGLHFHSGGGTLRIETESDCGKAAFELPTRGSGRSARVSLRARYVAEFVRILPRGSTCGVCMRDGKTAVLFSAPGCYRYLVMPLANR